MKDPKALLAQMPGVALNGRMSMTRLKSRATSAFTVVMARRLAPNRAIADSRASPTWPALLWISTAAAPTSGIPHTLSHAIDLFLFVTSSLEFESKGHFSFWPCRFISGKS